MTIWDTSTAVEVKSGWNETQNYDFMVGGITITSVDCYFKKNLITWNMNKYIYISF